MTLKLDNVSVRYGQREAVSDVTLELRQGEILALLGANGAGKSTLIKTMNDSVRPTSGTVRIGDRPIEQFSRREVARNIAVVAQENETRFPMTVLEFVLSGRFIYGGAFGWESDDDIAKANSALDECDLSGFAARQMNHLSGGERQRVVLARALAAQTPILLLDEPTANLDLAHQAMMFRLVRERCDNLGVSAVVITHDLNLAAAFADTVLLLTAGRIAAMGSARDVLSAENIANAFGVKVLLDDHPLGDSVRVTNVF